MKVLVTGGSRGLGAAIVKELAKNKEDHIFFTYANSPDKANDITGELINTTTLHCDFSDAGSVDSFILKLQCLDIDILINNAFVGFEKEHFQKSDPLKFLTHFELNVMPTIKITQAAISIFRRKRFGKIINIASSSNINKPPIGMSDYAACKSYILSMSKSWATENIRHNITSNSISPSLMKTDFTNFFDPRIMEQTVASHPLKQLLTVEEVAETILFLTKCSQQINGINLVINAGDDLL